MSHHGTIGQTDIQTTQRSLQRTQDSVLPSNLFDIVIRQSIPAQLLNLYTRACKCGLVRMQWQVETGGEVDSRCCCLVG
jgi:hypothetical protein